MKIPFFVLILFILSSQLLLTACSGTEAPVETTPTLVPSPTPLPAPSSTPKPTLTAEPDTPSFIPAAGAVGLSKWLPPTTDQALVESSTVTNDVDPALNPYLDAAENHFGNVAFTQNNEQGAHFRWNAIARSESGNVLWAYKVKDGKRILQDNPKKLVHN